MSSSNERRSTLESVGYNTAFLDRRNVDFDFLSDSWLNEDFKTDLDAQNEGQLETILGGLFPYEKLFPVFRGRYAEAILASNLELEGKTVLVNSLFPSTAYHLTVRGASLSSVSVREALDPTDKYPFKGNFNLEALEEKLDTGGIALVFVEMCANGIGGQPVSLENLQAVHSLAKTAGVPLVLDGTRLWTNAYMLKERERSLADKPLDWIAAQICRASDMLTAGLTKDFRVSTGGLIGINDEQLAFKVQAMLDIMYGRGLSPNQCKHMAHQLEKSEENSMHIEQRVSFARDLYKLCETMGIATHHPEGGHGLFIDAGRVYSHLADTQNPAETLVSELYLLQGIRAAPNLHGLPLCHELRHLVRLAICVGNDYGDALDKLRKALEHVFKSKDNLKGLMLESQPDGIGAPYLKRFCRE